MTHVWIAQCLCPERHCILAASDEAATQDELISLRDCLSGAVAALLAKKILNPWCGICGAAQASWTIEVAPTSFETMREAEPVLRREEEKQAAAKAVIGR